VPPGNYSHSLECAIPSPYAHGKILDSGDE
jgi:hypothetical protein